MANKHEKLQSECFLWMWNTFPKLRRLCWTTVNSHPAWGSRELSILKAVGLVKGVTDLVFYYKGVLHVFDVKIGSDRLKPEQKEFIANVEANGGKGYEIRSLEQFQNIIEEILCPKHIGKKQ